MTSALPNFRLLAAFQALAGLVIVPFLAVGGAENLLAGVTAVVWLALAGINWLLADRLPASGFETSLYVSALALVAHTAGTPRPQMQVLDGLELLVLGIFAAFALEPMRVNVWLTIAGAAYLVALVVNPLPIGAWLGPVIVIMVAATTTVVRNLITQVREVSRRDQLTGALNRWGLADQAALLQAVAQRNKTPLSVVFVDLDAFKVYNDSHGHLAGDQLLRDLAVSLQGHLRAEDLIARIGGDEFILVLAGTTSTEADEVMQRIEARLPTRVSHGTVDWPPGVDLATAIDMADRMMYERKSCSRQDPPALRRCS